MTDEEVVPRFKRRHGLHGEGYGTGWPNDADYSDIELKYIEWSAQAEFDASGYAQIWRDANPPETQRLPWLCRLRRHGWRRPHFGGGWTRTTCKRCAALDPATPSP